MPLLLIFGNRKGENTWKSVKWFKISKNTQHTHTHTRTHTLFFTLSLSFSLSLSLAPSRAVFSEAKLLSFRKESAPRNKRRLYVRLGLLQLHMTRKVLSGYTHFINEFCSASYNLNTWLFIHLLQVHVYSCETSDTADISLRGSENALLCLLNIQKAERECKWKVLLRIEFFIWHIMNWFW
jgi:hypothetical protein